MFTLSVESSPSLGLTVAGWVLIIVIVLVLFWGFDWSGNNLAHKVIAVAAALVCVELLGLFGFQ